MRLKWCSVGLVTAALLVGMVWYWHAAATSVSWSYSELPPSVRSEELSWEKYAEARVSWRAYRRLHDAIDLGLLHATFVVATAAAISLVGLAGRAAICTVGKASASVASRSVAALRSAPALLGAVVLLYLVAGGGGGYARLVWRAPHPAVGRLREIGGARQALSWTLENGMTTAEVLAAIPDHELKPKAVSEESADMLRTLPSGYQDTDSYYEFKPCEFRSTIYLWLQFRDDRLINFDRPAWEDDLRTVIAGAEPVTIAISE